MPSAKAGSGAASTAATNKVRDTDKTFVPLVLCIDTLHLLGIHMNTLLVLWFLENKSLVVQIFAPLDLAYVKINRMEAH